MIHEYVQLLENLVHVHGWIDELKMDRPTAEIMTSTDSVRFHFAIVWLGMSGSVATEEGNPLREEGQLVLTPSCPQASASIRSLFY